MADLIRNGADETIHLSHPLNLIGRSTSCHCIIEHIADISREHACVRKYDESTFTLVDYSSRNGTFLNDEQVYDERPLQHLDRVRVGKYVEYTFSNPSKNETLSTTRSIARLHRAVPIEETVKAEARSSTGCAMPSTSKTGRMGPRIEEPGHTVACGGHHRERKRNSHMGNVRVRGYDYRGKGSHFVTFGTLKPRPWLSPIIGLEPAGERLMEA